MPAKNESTGTTGLFKIEVDGVERYQVDYRYRDAKTGRPKRYKKRFPPKTPKAYAVAEARRVVLAAHAGTLQTEREELASKLAADAAATAAQKPMLSEAFDLYYSWLRSERHRPQAAGDRAKHKAQLLAVIGDMRTDQLTREHVARFIRARTGDGMSHATINRGLATFGQLVRAGAAGDLYSGVPIFSAEQAQAIGRIQKLEEPAERVRWLQGDQGERLFAVLPAWLYDLAKAAALTGCRQGELRLLPRTCVDLDGGRLSILKTKTNRNRYLAIGDDLADVLTRCMARSRCMLVFTDEKGEPVTKDRITHAFTRAARKAGIGDFHFHDLRHHFATTAIANGAELYTVQRVLGHTNPATTTKYAHVGDRAMREALVSVPSPDAPRMPLRVIQGGAAAPAQEAPEAAIR